MLQKTLKDIVSFSGVGLHTGCHVNVRILPAAEDTGITFVRTDIPDAPAVKAVAENVVATNYATSIGLGGTTVATVEHLMAAFYMMAVDNAVVEIDGPEVPILDGSAELFIQMMEGVGFRLLSAPRKYIVVKRPIKVTDGDKYALLMPAEDMVFTIDYSIDFSHPFLTKQNFSGHFSADDFKREIASARTFGFLRDVEMLRANGLAKGGSLSNAVVISDTEVLNEEGMRWPDEPVRHKVLDLMGDIALIGAPVVGHLIAYRSGHALNLSLVNKTLKKSTRWELADRLVRPEVPRHDRFMIQKAATV